MPEKVLPTHPEKSDSEAFTSSDDEYPDYVVGIGASAGGLEALEQFFTAMPVNAGLAYVVVQHLSPDFKSVMDELLGRYTSMPVQLAEEGLVVKRNCVYLIPPKKEMVISNGTLLLTDKDPKKSLSLPIDVFFRSLAADRSKSAIAVVLSGTGSDGSRGTANIKKAGGFVIAQSLESAKFDGMPKSAIDTGAVNSVSAPEFMANVILGYIKSPLVEHTENADPPSGMLALEPHELIFKRLREEFQIDFAYYKPSTVNRRIERRMNFHKVKTLEQYSDILLDNAGEVKALYEDLLIGVTEFFRDPEAFEILEKEVIPKLLREAEPGESIRVWVPGCATGEEAYSIACLFAEQSEIILPDGAVDVKIFATDLHKDSVNFAAAGLYSKESLKLLTEDRKERFFEQSGELYRVRAEIRSMIVFAEQNLIKDPPFTKIDLISCRNLLIYFQPIAQKKVLSMFLFALRVNGVLFLGPSETLGTFENEFDPLNHHWNLFRKRKDVRMTPGVGMTLNTLASFEKAQTRKDTARQDLADAGLSRAYDSLLEEFMPSSILLNKNRNVIHVFGDAIRYVNMPRGRASLDILSMVKDDLQLAMNTGIQRAIKKNRPSVLNSIRVTANSGETELINLSITSLVDGSYFLVTFEIQEALPPYDDSPIVIEGKDTLRLTQESSRQIENLERELQVNKENLKATIEELETSNEELQATNEQLQTTNEELVASNQELQSSNEELQSVNEELVTVNSEYDKNNKELTQLNADMDQLLLSTEIGTIFIDKDLHIRRYTPAIGRNFNLLPQDIDRPLEHITYNFEGEPNLPELVKEVIDTANPLEREIQHSESGWFLMRIYPYLTGDKESSGAVITLIDITPIKDAERKLSKQADLLKRSNQDLENFAYVVSHDLQEPLRTISSYLDLLRRKYENELDEDALDFIAFSISGATNMRQRVEDLLSYSRVETRGKDFQLERADSVVNEVLKNLSDTISENKASLHYDLSEVELWVDRAQIVNLFQILILNALKFRSEKNPEIYVWARRVGDDWQFTVKDNGIGISDKDFQRIFDVFQKVHSREDYPGSGMGLAIAKRIVIRHGCKIWVESQPGRGASLCFNLPAKAPDHLQSTIANPR